MNPAFAGNTHFSRFSTHVRQQWPAVQGYSTSGFYYDQNLPWFNSGVGVSMFQDRQAGSGLTYKRYSGLYSYRFKINRKTFVRMGVSASYSSFDVDLTKFTFTDQLISGSSSTSDEYRFDRMQWFDVNTGGVLYTENYWIGASVSNLNNIRASSGSPFPVKYSFHGGVLIPIHRDIKGEFLKNLTLAGQYKAQQDYDQLDVGAYYGYSMVLIGLWYRALLGLKDNETSVINHDAFIIVAGLNYQGYRLTYSYDITASTLHSHTMGAHELSLQVDLFRNFKYKRKRNSEINVPCPKFGGPGWQIEKN